VEKAIKKMKDKKDTGDNDVAGNVLKLSGKYCTSMKDDDIPGRQQI
jgi:hypothetical protein